MKKFYYTLVMGLCIAKMGLAQIVAAPGACAGTPVSFSSSEPAVTYHWDFNGVSVDQPISAVTPMASGLPSLAWTCFMKDGANYYMFATNYATGNITRLNYGTSIYSTPVVTHLGSMGGTAPYTECIDLVKDSTTGNWFGLVVNNSQMIVLSFGSSLSNTPTSTVTTYSQIQWAHQVTIKRWHGNWHAFVANRNGGITRFDFGTALTNVPVITNLPMVGGIAHPCNFSLYQQNDQWYMIVTNLINSNMTRLSFGLNLLNNTPTGALITPPAGMLNLPRTVFLLNDCMNHLLGYVVNEGGSIVKLDFAGNINTTPTFTYAGASGQTAVPSSAPCAVEDTLFYMVPSFSGGTVRKFRPFDLTPGTSLAYHSSGVTHTFSAPGTFDVSAFYDLARPSGPSVGCTSYLVTGVPLTGPSVLCMGGLVALTAPSPGGTWSASPASVATIGATTGVVNAVAPGTVTITYNAGSGCASYHIMTVTAIAVTASAPASAPAGSTVTVTATVSGYGLAGYFINWYRNGTYMATTTTPDVTFVKGTGTDLIKATAVAASSELMPCNDSAWTTVSISDDGTGVGRTTGALPGMQLFPNPAGKLLYLKVPDGVSYSILSVDGREILTGDVQQNMATIATDVLPQGVYLLRVTDTNGGVGVTRFSKQ
jgi:hypothetical protein